MPWKHAVDVESARLERARLVWYEAVNKYKGATGGCLPTSLIFHKTTTLAVFRLRERGIRFPFPYSWYLYGTEAEGTRQNILFKPDVTGRKTMVEWVSDIPELLPGDAESDAIRAEINAIFAERPRVESLVDEVYERAPFEFQRKYRLLRICLGTTGRGSRFQRDCEAVNPWALLLDALDTFPADRFHRLVRLIPAFKEAVKMAWNASPPDRDRTKELVEEFWRLFCCHLRLDRDGHEMISASQIKAWQEIAESRLSKWERIFGDILVEMATQNSAVGANHTLGPVVERRRREQQDEKETIDNALAVISENRASIDTVPESSRPQ
jgi:hypothetical protein